jgi:exosortase/archaeosortase family protein
MITQFKSKYPEIFFITTFLFLFFILYFGTEFWIGITSKGNYYNHFFDTYLNYIKWYRITILKSSVFLCNLFGYKAKMLNSIAIEGFNGFQVNMVYSCIGYGLLSFWTAFVATYPTQKKSKIKWLFGGVLIMWIANILRVSLLLILFNKVQDIDKFNKHHTIYNIVTYAIIFVLIYLFTKEKK